MVGVIPKLKGRKTTNLHNFNFNLRNEFFFLVEGKEIEH
jgi:hypothetical protein